MAKRELVPITDLQGFEDESIVAHLPKIGHIAGPSISQRFGTETFLKLLSLPVLEAEQLDSFGQTAQMQELKQCIENSENPMPWRIEAADQWTKLRMRQIKNGEA